VQTPDHVVGSMEFENGAIGTLIQSFATHFCDFAGPARQPITLFGTEGTVKVPDPNAFDGPVSLRRIGEEQWREMPHAFASGYGRSVGLADLACAIRSGRPHRCSAEQAFTVLDLMEGFLDSSDSGRVCLP